MRDGQIWWALTDADGFLLAGFKDDKAYIFNTRKIAREQAKQAVDRDYPVVKVSRVRIVMEAAK